MKLQLKYCIQLCSPQHEKDMELLERVRRRPQQWPEGWDSSAARTGRERTALSDTWSSGGACAARSLPLLAALWTLYLLANPMASKISRSSRHLPKFRQDGQPSSVPSLHSCYTKDPPITVLVFTAISSEEVCASSEFLWVATVVPFKQHLSTLCSSSRVCTAGQAARVMLPCSVASLALVLAMFLHTDDVKLPFLFC